MRKELKFKGVKTWLSLKNGLMCCAVAFLALLPAQLQAGPSHLLANDKIRVALSDDGKLEAVGNLLAAETYSFGSDSFALDTDLGMFSNVTTSPVRVAGDTQRIVYEFEFGPKTAAGVAGVKLDLIYTLTAGSGFFRRTLSVSNAVPLRVKDLVFGRTTFSSPARETVHYVTFIAAPTVEFIRHDKGGLFTGIENPYFQAGLSEQGVTLGFEPALILKAGEGYTSEPQFMGVYKKSGVMIEDTGRDFRYNSNGSGYKPIDRNEMRAMRAFALDYLAPAQQNFLNINYQFFHPLPQMPRTQKDKDYFTHTIDMFSAIGGDMIIFKPLHPYTKPDANRPYWNVVPDDTNATARQICDHAAGKGISYGFYMGCAAHGGEGNAGGLNFRPDKPEWKKSDAAGRRAPDNCLACDDYFEWWFTVQNNTIRKYHLSNWSWDPSLGSGMNCYDESHGHIAGKGGYKGWRRCMELMARLKAANPGLFIQGFYGTKNFGLWGFKNVDQHEVLNEQSIIVSTRHNQISDDRQNADGLRYQNNLSMRYRFTPAVMGHALTHRVSEGGFDPELIKAWDYYGWQYGVMSALATSGSVMPTILPYDKDLAPGYVEFYKQWQRWAKDNFASVNATEPFGEQVQPGAVDGYARIKGDHGFIFLFNGNPRSSLITFEVGDEINLQAKGDYQFAELYPSEKEELVCDENGKSVFALGDKTSMTVPANSCQLLELRRVVKPTQPVLVGLAGAVTLTKGRLAIAGVAGNAGETARVCVRLTDPKTVQAVTVNGVEQKFVRTEREVCLEVRFAGAKHVRELDAWTQANGKPFDFPYHAAQPELKLTTTFTLNADVRRLLEKARPKNFAEMDARIAGWQTPESKRNASYSYHNFICERPSRLWLIIPFLTRTGVELAINGEKIDPLSWDDPSSSAFADVTDRVKYDGENSVTLSLKGMAPNRFMGPFLLYPQEAATDRVLPSPGSTDKPVRYTRALIPAPQPRYRKGDGPKVIEAKMMENVTLRESAELRVKLDLPPERIKRVMFFESGFKWMGQHGLGYDKEAQCWTARVEPGSRAAIQENEYLYVWAEGADGLRSDYHPVKVGWDFTATARNAKVVAGAIEAEFLKVQSKSRSRVEPQDMSPYGNHWSGGSQMVWWGGLEQGDSMVLEIPLEKAGVYALALHLSKAEDYGIFSVRLDDGPETEAMDLFHSKLQPPTIITLKPMTLAKGKHSLRITCHGKNPQSSNSLIGIDCLEFKETTRLDPVGKPRITVRADQVLHPVSRFLTGACIEDVNHEIYGGLYSQMIFGESFEEAAMPLPANTPAFAGLSGAVSCRAPRREIAGSDVRSWQPFRTGSAEGVFAVETAAPFNGRQSQRMTFASGTGAVGIENRGLNRQGMCFQAGKPYEGYVWVRRDPGADAAPVALQVALENAEGSKLHARTELAVARQHWQRLDFVLTPDAADSTGRFSITLTRPGTVVLGHAFLQPGAWGRFKGLPVRKDVVEGMLRQGLTALRYGGSMVNGSDEYRWKKMLGPRDLRPPYRGTWYEYSSNGWGILDFIDLCEAAQFACVPCFNTGESAQDMADFVEYVNGPADSEWGRKRAEAGHPEPYRLKYLQLGNEQHVDGGYYEAFTRLAGAIWKQDAGITLIVGVHWDPDQSIDQHAEHYRCLIEFARDRNQTVWFDVHVWNDKPQEPDLAAFDRFVGRLAGFGMDNYRICVLEENAGNHSMKRALGHARALNLFQRSKLGLPILCAANGLQPDDQNDNGWNQGTLFLNPSQVWLQPPGHVTQMVSRNYQPLCVSARVDGPASPLDVTATRSEDGGTLVLQVLNASGDPVPARIVIAGFTPAEPTAEAVQLLGRPDDTNTADEPARIVPETKPDALRLRDGNADYTFPGGSFTILRFRGGAGAAHPSASAGKVPAKSAEWAKQINKTKLPDEVRAQQVKDLKFGMFICWSFSTFHGEEWTPTTGKDASYFKATGCDTDQWCKTAREAGMNYILFLTKHHDGFCLWDTDTTDKKVTNSPLGIDVLAKLKDSCDRHGIKLALYFSDGDWTWPKAKDGQYMAGGEDPEMKKAQLKELLTRYGPIEYFWLDTAVGVGGLDRKPTIDWIHEFQPNAFVGYPHKGIGPRMTMREMGRPGPFDEVEKERGYLVAEFTYPILPPHKGGANWFYSLPEHDNLCKKAGDLYKDYQEGVKHGNVFALNVGPDYAGRLRDIDVRTLREIGELIRTNAP